MLPSKRSPLFLVAGANGDQPARLPSSTTTLTKNESSMPKLKNTCAVALAAALTILSAAAAQAAVCTVPSGSYLTIQSAASDPNCNTINVAPGTYNENVTVAFANTTINGGQVGNSDFTTRSANPAGESIVNGATPTGSVAVFSIIAANVRIDGFTIKNSVTAKAAIGVAIRAGGDDAVIINNIFDTITTPDAGDTAQAVYLTAGGPDNVNIEDNEMKNIQSNRSAKGVLIGDNGGTNPSQNVQVKGNSIHDITSGVSGAYGVLVARVPNVSGLMIANNTVSNLTSGGWVHAIGLEGDTPGVVVTDNAISNLIDTTPTVPPNSICVWFEDNPSFGSAEVHDNNFFVTTASFGIAVHPALSGGSVDGTCNWWNSPSGPTTPSNPGGTGALVSDKVTYAPWLNGPAPGGSCFAVVTNSNQCKKGGWMTRIRSNGTTFKNQGDCMQYTKTGK